MALACKNSSLAVWIYLCFCILSACGSVDNQQTADAIYINGRIWTGAGDDVFVSALAVKGNTILAAGSDDEIKAFKSEKTQVVDLQGHLVALSIHPKSTKLKFC